MRSNSEAENIAPSVQENSLVAAKIDNSGNFVSRIPVKNVQESAEIGNDYSLHIFLHLVIVLTYLHPFKWSHIHPKVIGS